MGWGVQGVVGVVQCVWGKKKKKVCGGGGITNNITTTTHAHPYPPTHVYGICKEKDRERGEMDPE